MRQAKEHSDVLLLQDTHLDANTINEVVKEWSGQWGFNNRQSNSGGVGLFVNNAKNNQIQLLDDGEIRDDNGSLLGRPLKRKQ